MARVCEMWGKKPVAGRSIVRKGSPKYKGGIGLHTPGLPKRRFLPNLHDVRASAGKGNTKRMCLCAKCIKSGKVANA